MTGIPWFLIITVSPEYICHIKSGFVFQNQFFQQCLCFGVPHIWEIESEYEEKIYEYTFSYFNNVIKEIEYENIYQGTTNYVFNYLGENTIEVIGTNSDETDTYTLILNADGYIESCHHLYSGPEGNDNEDYNFIYNEYGQLITMVRSEEEETWNIEYNAFNAVNVSCNERNTNDISYGNLISPENMIMFEWMYGMDVDDMSIFGFIGMLGKSSNNLPVVNDELVDGFTTNYDWSLDESGYPIKVIIDENGFENEVKFTWQQKFYFKLHYKIYPVIYEIIDR